MIKPTIGRQVWFWDKRPLSPLQQAEAATVIYVTSDTMVSLAVLSHVGAPRAELNVPLVQDGHVTPDFRYCEWMPYQKGQAAKTEQLESAVAAANVHAMGQGSAS